LPGRGACGSKRGRVGGGRETGRSEVWLLLRKIPDFVPNLAEVWIQIWNFPDLGSAHLRGKSLIFPQALEPQCLRGAPENFHFGAPT